MLSSLRLAAPRREFSVTLLGGDDLSQTTAGSLQKFANQLGVLLHILRMPTEFETRFPSAKPYSETVWRRLFLPELIPNLDRVLYLDADTIVCSDPFELLDCELDDAWLAAVASPVRGWEHHIRSIGVDPEQRYFNSGVLMMDLKAMRASRFTDEAVSAARELAGKYRFPDQDVLNRVCAGRWKKLPPKWNAFAFLWMDPQHADDSYEPLEYQMAAASPGIIHFEGSVDVKPWHFRSMHPYRHLYRELRKRTPWGQYELEGRSLTAAVLRRLPRHWQYLIANLKRRLQSGRVTTVRP